LLDSQISTLKRKIDYNTNTIFQQEKEKFTEMKKLGFNEEESISIQVPKIIAKIP
jgi:hypothetical protein